MTGAGTTSMVDVRELSVRLDGVTVLDGVDLSVPTGAWVTVIGPNGAGKSTLLRAVAGLLRFVVRGGTGIASGSVELAGVAVRSMSRRRMARQVALVPQSPVVPAGMAVLDYVLLGRTPYLPVLGREGSHDLDVVAGVIRQLDLDGFADRPLVTLSGGERQRAFLARALAQGPTVLLLDEPTSALDIGHQQEVLELVDELRRREGLTVLSTMHDLVIAGEYADRMVLLDNGAVVASGTPADVLTTEHLARHYGAQVRVVDLGSGPLVVPVRRRPDPTSG
ncbi:MAG: ABC transporter ATP-binding protein [Micromonosporaceae bacterium]